jgi:hypothetical protein
MREREARRRAEAAGPATIRLELPDGHVLQAAFPAAAPLSGLQALAARALAGHAFYLFTAPPKKVLEAKEGDTFFSAKMVPGARVHVGIKPAAGTGGKQGEEGEGKEGEGPLLAPEVLGLVGPPPPRGGTSGQESGARDQAKGHSDRWKEARVKVERVEGGQGSGGRGSGAGSGRSAVPGAPKWMKLGGR